MRGWWREITGLVLPAACGGCGKPRTGLCEECAAALCGAVPCRAVPAPERAGLPEVYAAAPYENAVRAILLAHKERGALGLAGALGGALAGAVRAGTARSCASGPLLLVPVPSVRRSTAARGHDPARRIALAAARDLRRTGISARTVPVLRHRRAVADQAGLGARERQANLAGALAVVAGGARLLDGGPVVLVDDLLTTGATLSEAARAIRAATGIRGATGAEGAGAATDAVRAAVVSASPAALQINRN